MLLYAVAHAAQPEELPINAERPGFSSSPVLLAPGKVQLEAGYEYVSDAVDVQTLPLALVRVGVADGAELQLSWPGYRVLDAGGTERSGAGDFGVGVKLALADAEAAMPLALFAGVSVPSNDDDVSSGSVDVTAGAFWTRSAGLDWFGTVLVGESDGEVTISNAVGVSRSLGARTGGYVEYVVQFPESGGDGHFVNGGLTFTPTATLQWDLQLGVGLDDDAADGFVGLGMAHRF